MSRFTNVLTQAQRRRAEAAARDVEAHQSRCLLCKTARPCADKKVLELVAEMHASKAIAQ